MLGHRQLNLDDYWAILRRRWWAVVFCTIVALGAALLVSYLVPPKFQSQTLVLVEQQKVPTDYVTPVVTEDLGARLASMQEQILSRSRIEPIIQRFNLFPKEASMDDRIAKTQKAIGIKPIPSSPSSHGMPGFYITFSAPDARTAQQVCGEITSLFVSENLNAREQSAEGTTDFLKQQLADAKRTLDEQDEKLADFERKYIGRLPNQESSNQSTLQALTTQLDAATQSLDRLQQNETLLQALVNQQERDQQDTQPTSGPSIDEDQKKLSALQDQRRELQAHYTDSYPDVVAVTHQIEELQKELASKAPANPQKNSAVAGTHAESPQLFEQKAQLHAEQQAIAAARRNQAGIQDQIRIYEGRIDSTPVVEEQYKQVTRDHDTALEFYNSLLKKMNESSMATALEQRQEGEQFRVMDAPNLPESPAFPNRLEFAGGGMMAGLILGLMIAAFLEYRDDTIRSEDDLLAFAQIQLLGIIGHLGGMPNAPEEQPRRPSIFRRKETLEETGA